MKRRDGRGVGDLRPLEFRRGFTEHSQGSVLTSCGGTRVLCTATMTDGVPPFLQGKGKGWLTAEYSMLPSSTHSRKPRERAGKLDGRGVEIQRLIGRALRGVMDLSLFGERTIWLDCDVLQADGGTRTTAINGAWVALYDCLTVMDSKRLLRGWPLSTQLGAISLGIVDGTTLCDLDYSEDSRAEVDLNLVMTSASEIIEIQGAAEKRPFTRGTLDEILTMGEDAIRQIFEAQKEAVGAGR